MAKDLDKLFDSGQQLDQVFDKGQDLEQSKQPEEEKPSSTVGDFGKGVHQGMMLGGADELGGLGSAIGQTAAESDLMTKLSDWYYAQKLGTSPEAEKIANTGLDAGKAKSFYEKYREGQQAEEKDFKDAQNASPWAYGAGQVVGGLIPGIASGGLAKAAPMATAVGAGGLSGGLSSESTIEEPLELAKDVGIGSATGAALQKLLPGGTPKPEQDILKRGEFLPQLQTAKELGEQGLSLSAKPEARQALTRRLQENERSLTKSFTKPRTTLGKALEDTISAGDKTASEAAPMTSEFFDTIGDIGSAIKNNMSSIGRKRGTELLQKLDDLKQGLLKPSEMNALQKELSDTLSNSEIPELRSTLKTGVSEIRKQIESMSPGFKKAAGEFKDFAEAGPESLLSRGFDPEVSDVFFGDLTKGNLKVAEKVRSLLNTIRSGGKEGLQKQGEFFSAMKQLEDLAQNNPELVQKLGLDPAKLTREFIKKADESAVALKTAGKSLPEAGIERGVRGIRAIGEEAILKGANKYGLTKKSMKDFVSGTKEDLAQAAAKLSEHGGPDLQSLGNSLADAIKIGDIRKQNAAIFSIMQLPKAKDILNIGEE